LCIFVLDNYNRTYAQIVMLIM